MSETSGKPIAEKLYHLALICFNKLEPNTRYTITIANVEKPELSKSYGIGTDQFAQIRTDTILEYLKLEKKNVEIEYK